MRIALCDDDEKALIKNKEILKECLSETKIVADIRTYRSSDFLLYDIQENNYFDLLLLDIEMPKNNGMQIAKDVKKLCPETLVIFITSHSEYAIDSFELSVFRYIEKGPTIKEKLSYALIDGLNYIEIQKDEMYTITTPTRYERIPYRKILYIKKDGKYVVLTTINGETQIRKPLAEVYDEINSDEFVYIDRSCIVNLIHLMRIEKMDAIMRNGVSLPISKKRLGILKDIINEYWSQHV
jgi:putative response regulator receiver domain protein